MSSVDVCVGTRPIGPGYPCYMIAEIGFNNSGSVELGAEMIRAAARAGAHAVKFQTYATEELCLTSSEHFDLVRSGEMDRSCHEELQRVASAENVTFISTPFSTAAVEMLDDLGVPAFKIASMDLTNTILLDAIAQTGKPVLLSTGMGTLSEIQSSLDRLDRHGAVSRTVLLHCVSHYPTAAEDANLDTMRQLSEAFQRPTGFSDHTMGTAVPLAAIALGATVIEKHFTTDRTLDGPDHVISSTPDEFEIISSGAKTIAAALGHAIATLDRPDRANAEQSRRGLYSRRALEKGTILSAADIKAVRPKNSLAPIDLPRLIGRRLKVSLAAEQAMRIEHLEADEHE